MSSETLEVRPALLYSDTQSLVGFPRRLSTDPCFRAGTSSVEDCDFRKQLHDN